MAIETTKPIHMPPSLDNGGAVLHALHRDYGIVADGGRRRIESVEIAPMIMRDLGVDPGPAQAPPHDAGVARADHVLA